MENNICTLIIAAEPSKWLYNFSMYIQFTDINWELFSNFQLNLLKEEGRLGKLEEIHYILTSAAIQRLNLFIYNSLILQRTDNKY